MVSPTLPKAEEHEEAAAEPPRERRGNTRGS